MAVGKHWGASEGPLRLKSGRGCCGCWALAPGPVRVCGLALAGGFQTSLQPRVDGLVGLMEGAESEAGQRRPGGLRHLYLAGATAVT